MLSSNRWQWIPEKSLVDFHRFALNSYIKQSWIQAGMTSAPVVGRHTWLPTFNLSLILTTLGFIACLNESVSFRAHTRASVTEVSLLPVLVCGTPCRHTSNRTRTTDISRSHWNILCLGYNRLWHTVTNCFCVPYELNYLLTKWHILMIVNTQIWQRYI